WSRAPSTARGARSRPWCSARSAPSAGSRSPSRRRPRARRGGSPSPCWPSVRVEAPSHLAPEPACRHVLPEQRARPVLVVAELAVQHLGDGEAGVEADEGGELERPHRVVEPELHTLVNVLDGAEPLVERVAGLVEERDEDPVHDEAGD